VRETTTPSPLGMVWRRVGGFVAGCACALLAVRVLLAKALTARLKKRALAEGTATDRRMPAPQQAEPTGPELISGDFVLLALFDGIRGCSEALGALGVEPHADYSSELDKNCRRLIAAKYPRCIQIGDVQKIDRAALEAMVAKHGVQRPWLVVGGSPCQDLSIRRGQNRRGLAGKKSKLFFEFVRVVSTLRSLGVEVVFLLENVSSMSDEDRDAISASLGVDPVEIDAAVMSACHRQRYYWTNLPVEPVKPRAIDIDSLLYEGWCRLPKGKPFRCFVSSAAWQAKRGREPLGIFRQAAATAAGSGSGSGGEAEERAPNAGEREAILGFPRGHTRLRGDDGEDLFPEGLRLKLLGNSFSVQVVSHLLAPIAASARDGQRLELRPLREDAMVVRMNRICGSAGPDEGDEEVEGWELN